MCYGDLPGFGLSETGHRQAMAAAARVAALGIDVVVSSPLQRALETAQILAAGLALEVQRDERLTEWALGRRWAGTVWQQLPEKYPGELEAYLDHPQDLPFSPEPLAAVAERMTAAVEDIGAAFPDGVAVIVSHQDPVQAARLHLTGIELARLPEEKPGHCTIISLGAGYPWLEREVWHPDVPAAPFPPPDEVEHA